MILWKAGGYNKNLKGFHVLLYGWATETPEAPGLHTAGLSKSGVQGGMENGERVAKRPVSQLFRSEVKTL